MSSSTKITLALLVLFAGAIALYYIVNSGPALSSAATPTEVADATAAKPARSTTGNGPAVPGNGGRTGAAKPGSGVSGHNNGLLTESLTAARGPGGSTTDRTSGAASTLPLPLTTDLATTNAGGAPDQPIEPDKDGVGSRSSTLGPSMARPAGTGLATSPPSTTTATPGAPALGPSNPAPSPRSTDARPPGGGGTADPRTAPPGAPSGAPVVPPATTVLSPATEPVKPVSATTTPRTQTYTVAEGDNLWSIAQAWFGDGNKWDLIAKANPFVDPEHLKVGQVLNLPTKDAQRPVPVAPPASSGPSGGPIVYVVTSGDTLRQIARTYYGDANKWPIIFEVNNAVMDGDPHTLKVGMKLTIPPAPTAAAPARPIR